MVDMKVLALNAFIVGEWVILLTNAILVMNFQRSNLVILV